MTELETILAAQVPATTRTYSPISHAQLIDEVKEQLDRAGLAIKREYYSQNRSGQQMFGSFTVTADNEMDLNFGFRNSYDKSLQLGLVAGTRVIVCSNLMFKGDHKSNMMHTGDSAKQLRENVIAAVNSLETNYAVIRKDSDRLKEVEVDRAKIAELIGEMLMFEDLITSTQVKIIKGELDLKTNFSDRTMWDIYNHTTEALKVNPVSTIIDSHIGVHNYFLTKI